MLRQMERSAIKVLAKRGRSQRQIAKELGHSRVTIRRVLREPVDQQPAKRHIRRADGLASAAAKALVDVLDHPVGERQAAVAQSAHQMNPAARRIGLQTEH